MASYHYTERYTRTQSANLRFEMGKWDFEPYELVDALREVPEVTWARPYKYEVQMYCPDIEAAKEKIRAIAAQLHARTSREAWASKVQTSPDWYRFWRNEEQRQTQLIISFKQMSWLEEAQYNGVCMSLKQHTNTFKSVLPPDKGVMVCVLAKKTSRRDSLNAVKRVLAHKARNTRVTAPNASFLEDMED